MREVEDINFAFTNISLNKTYQMSFNQALQMFERGGGKMERDQVTIVCQQPKAVRYEKNFERHYPTKKFNIRGNLYPNSPTVELEFDGIGFVVRGGVRCDDRSYVALVEVYETRPGRW